MGADVVVVNLTDNLEQAVAAAKALPAVEEVTTGPQGLTISTADGAGLVAEVAVAFSRQGISRPIVDGAHTLTGRCFPSRNRSPTVSRGR